MALNNEMFAGQFRQNKHLEQKFGSVNELSLPCKLQVRSGQSSESRGEAKEVERGEVGGVARLWKGMALLDG